MPDGQDDPDAMRDFVQHYLAARGFRMTTRNARVVVAALATCTAVFDWRVMERHVDSALDPDMLHRAA